MRHIKRLLSKAILIGLALSFASSSVGCFHREVYVLPDSEALTPHPTIETKVCLDKGYLLRIYEAMESCRVGIKQ